MGLRVNEQNFIIFKNVTVLVVVVKLKISSLSFTNKKVKMSFKLEIDKKTVTIFWAKEDGFYFHETEPPGKCSLNDFTQTVYVKIDRIYVAPRLSWKINSSKTKELVRYLAHSYRWLKWKPE